MLIVGLLALIICLLGLFLYLALTGFSRASLAEVCKWMFICGLLAFLLGSGMQSCSIGTSGGGGSALHH